jgi:hypothetical protein
MGRFNHLLAVTALAAMAGCSAAYGPIRDKQTAIKVGCTVLLERMPNSKCVGLVAELNGDVWTVAHDLPPGYVGGGPIVKLSKSDGRVLDFYVTQ